MVSYQKVHAQFKALQMNPDGWGHTEVKELCNILTPDEVVESAVNGYYEAGFALLVATKNRVLIVDKKPLNYLTVEDMRFDMINEFDYQHRLLGAQIKISSGSKVLHFTSLNQVRLRRVMSYVQHRMTEMKQEQVTQQETQQRHLEQMNKQLEMYLQLQQVQQQRAYYGQQPQYIEQPDYLVRQDERGTESISPARMSVNAMKRVVPVIGAYTRLPLISQQRRYNTGQSSSVNYPSTNS
ncbi:MAG: PH domain-containing protein [Candidatus Saccharimonadales bacterium]